MSLTKKQIEEIEELALKVASARVMRFGMPLGYAPKGTTWASATEAVEESVKVLRNYLENLK